MKSQELLKPASIILNDRTDVKLFFATDFLSFLNDSKMKVRIHLNKARSRYGDYFRYFPNIQVMERYVPLESNGDEIYIDFIDKVDDINSQNLCYPVLDDQCTEEYEKNAESAPLQLIPLSRKQISDFRIGDLESAKDLLFRKLVDNDFAGKKFLISTGPTAEDIDPVRYLTNRSTGKMGLAMARAAFRRGAEIQMIIGPTNLEVPQYIPVKQIRSAAEMAKSVSEAFVKCDIYIGCAAIADYTPKTTLDNKLKKADGDLNLVLSRTEDVLKKIGAVRKNQILVGFSVETTAELENSKRKLQSKNLDLIVINNPKINGAAFGAETNLVTILSKNSRCEQYPLMSKLDVSHVVLDWIKEI